MVLPVYHVIISDKALVDMQAIADSPESSSAAAEMLLEAIDSLALLPLRFRAIGTSRKRNSSIHAMVVWPYIIYYGVKIGPCIVEVHAVRHGARKQPKRFG